MTEGILNYGLWLCKNRFASLQQLAKKGKMIHQLDAGIWQLEGLPAYKGRLNITVNDDVIDLKASLLEQDACAFGMECQLEHTAIDSKKGLDQFVVCNWKTYV